MPHDVIVTPDGTVWYDSFAEQILGKLDPVTGKTVEYHVADVETGLAQRIVGVAGRSGRQLWIGMAYQAAVARFDPKTATFRVFPVPPERNKDYVADHRGGTDAPQRRWQSVDRGFRHLFDLPARRRERQVSRCSSRSRSPARIFTTSPAIRRTTCISPCSAAAISAGWMQRPERSRHGRRRRPTRRRGAARWMTPGKLWFGEFRADKIGMFDTGNVDVPRMDAADAVVFPIRRRCRPQRRRLGRLDAGGPGGAARSAVRHVHRIFVAAAYQHAAVVRR